MRLAIYTIVGAIVGAVFGFFMAYGQQSASTATVFAFSGQMCILFGFVTIWLILMLGKEEIE
jgi:sulfite exporter TauE/SafE